MRRQEIETLITPGQHSQPVQHTAQSGQSERYRKFAVIFRIVSAITGPMLSV